MTRHPLAILAGAALAAVLAGCGGAHHRRAAPGLDASRGRGSSTATTPRPPKPATLTIFSSLPLKGPEASQGRAIARGMLVAFKQHGTRIGAFQIRYQSLDDATASEAFSSQREAANARQVATDKHAIVYVGDLQSGASRISIPIMSAAGIPQIIPGSPVTQLIPQPSGTRSAPRSTQAGSFVRLVATNAYQASAELAFLHDSVPTCKVLALPHGWDVDSRDLAQQIRIRSAKDDLETVGDAVVDPRQTTAFAHYRTNLTLHHANCAIYSGTVAEGAVAVMLALHQALAPGARMIGSSGICTAAWASPADGGLPASLDQDLYCTAPGPGPQATPEGQRFIKLYRKAYHAAPDPAAVYGYEAMTLALEVIAAEGAHGDSRQSVLQFLEIAGADESAIGRFSIEEDGDILASYPYSVYGVSRGRLVFDTTPGVGTKLVGAHAGHIETDG